MVGDSGTTGHRTGDATLDGLQGITLLDDERVLYDLQPAWSNWVDILALGTVLLPVFGVGLIFYAVVWLERRHTRYVVTDQRLIAQYGMLSVRTTEYRIAALQAVYTETGMIERLRGLGTVAFRTGGSSVLSFSGIPNYEAVADAVRERQRAFENSRV
ncbi:PH domain-containing protein [Halococcus dombrowskii]|uniref:PH domain-containing protein n=1 Tax=Halococcus dombrowskii TaxID=179637 RepID=A0AAV3SFY1_HALDO|nr:PH domain-containing protein [Halococcus dombrowskii]UOO94595.1 PH domain-containing protein [Halococcus dombrowskii]